LHVTGSFSKWVRKYFYRYMTVIVLTEKDRLAFEKLFKPLSCICIPNASPFEIDSTHYSPDHKTILAVGRFTAQKGFDLLVNSFSMISKKFPDWKLKIVGDDFGDKAVLERMIAEKQIKNIELLPSTKHIEKMYQSASFFVLSSRFEGLPMVLIEAMSFGLPLIAFDCPTGPAEIVNESNGFLVENGNIAELAQKMETLMNDRKLLLQKSKGALENAPAFSKVKIDKLWQNVL
jgi:amylovoran biosynthesis glycosyltransferase AmsD